MLGKIFGAIVNLFFFFIVAIALLISFGGDGEFDNAMPDTAQNEADDRLPNFPQTDDPESGPETGQETGQTLPAPSPFDGRSIVEAQNAKNWSSGTGFSIAADGLWLTAKHVTRGCDRLGILNENGRIAVKAEPIFLSETADVAIFKTQGGPTPLALDLDESDIKLGTRGFHVGYPQGKPGEVTSRLIGRELMVTQGAWRGKEDTLAWAETGRTQGLRGTLGGLSGGPAFDSKGNVVGITIAESPRRGRIVTTSAASVIDALSLAGVEPAGRAIASGSDQTPTRSAAKLRADLKVVQVICLTDS
jgi:serine protease Do